MPPEPAKTRRLGDFEILSKLGQGAMGSVYRARQLSTNREVALKVLPPELAKDEEMLGRFLREGRAGQKFNHPHIVATYEMGLIDQYHFIAMEYVDGQNLEAVLRKRGPLPAAELLQIADDIAQALAAAAPVGLVHRDIKPANILLSSAGVAKLADMGLASATGKEERFTLAGFAVGTPYYLSPEQARGERDVDPRADIYSLGATLYHLATGVVPFAGSNPLLVMTAHLKEPLVPPHERNPAIPLAFSSLIQYLMAKDPEERPQNAQALREVIAACRRGELQQRYVSPAARPAPALQAAGDPSSVWNRMEAWSSAHFRSLETLPRPWRLPVALGFGALAALVILAAAVVAFRAR